MIPSRLKKGDTIALTAPSKPMEMKNKRKIEKAIHILQKMGFKVLIGDSFKWVDKFGVSAGSAKMRAYEINKMFEDPKVNCIWCAWGGDTANETLDYIDYDLIKKNTEIFTGLSDNTILINTIFKETGLVTFHGTDVKVGGKDEYFDSKYSQNEFVKRFIKTEIGDIQKVSEWKCIRKGNVKGRILGGNLAGLMKVAGTKYWLDYTNSILLLEGYHTGVREAVFRLTQLKQIGVFDQVFGIVVGYYYSFDHDKQYDRDGRRLFFEDILLEITKDYEFPILKMNEFGHKCLSTFLPIGGMGEMDAEKLEFRIVEKCVK